MNIVTPSDDGLEAHKLLDQIEAAWCGATTKDEMRRALRQMCLNPAYRWRRYLDDLWVSRQEREAGEGESDRMAVLAECEDELSSAVAEGLARENGVVSAKANS